ncbi:MAG: hypothetical protein F6J87_22570 [Spirulina sp. SIO3F2]|nr:hypothetical protein [Spirulina sp. SIO3F2]
MLTLSLQTSDASTWTVIEPSLSNIKTQRIETVWGRSYALAPCPIEQVLQQAIDWVQCYPLNIMIDAPPVLESEQSNYPALAIAEQALTTTIANSLGLVITHHVFWQLPHAGQYPLRLIAQLTVPPPLERISLFEVFNTEPPEHQAKKQETKTQFEQALFLYFLGFYAEAECLFDECLTLNPMDMVASHYVQNCRNALATASDLSSPTQQNS